LKKFKELLEAKNVRSRKYEPLDVPLPLTGIKVGTIITLRDNITDWDIPDIKVNLIKKVMAQSENNTAKVIAVPNDFELRISNDDGITVATIERFNVLTQKEK
jgi:hypothetical protein